MVARAITPDLLAAYKAPQSAKEKPIPKPYPCNIALARTSLRQELLNVSIIIVADTESSDNCHF